VVSADRRLPEAPAIRLRGDTPRLGKGLQTVTTYLGVTDPNFDSRLRYAVARFG
jgi:hypothetical protein